MDESPQSRISNLESRIRNHLPLLLVLGLYLVCILIADPRGEFPLNDDWSYTRSAFAFGSGRGIQVDEWSAPSLVGQALYGGLLTRILSRDFLVLRVSTLFLSCSILVLLWATLVKLRFRRDFCAITILAWAFNPLQFSLSFTYMTEIPFLFFIALGFYLYVRHLDERRIQPLVFSAAALGYAFLIRQTALFFIVGLACSVALDSQKGIWSRLRRSLLVVGTSGLFVAGFYVLIRINGRTTAAVQRKFELLEHLAFRQVIGNGYGMLFYLALMLVPVWIFLIPSIHRVFRIFRRKTQVGVLICWCAVVVTGLCWFYRQYKPAEYLPSIAYHSRMPFLLNVLYDSGLGPITLDPAYFGAPPTPVYPQIWRAVTGVAALGAVLIGSILVLAPVRLRRTLLLRDRMPVILFAAVPLLSLAGFEIVFSHLQEGGLFDRHVLIISFPLYLLLGLLSGEAAAQPGEKRRLQVFVPLMTAAMMAAFCVSATHDYMEWNRIRWEMGRTLLSQGIDSLAIVGGFEFNAWNNYDKFAARGNIERVHYWWFDRRDYVISMSPQDGYEIRQTKQYYSWVHRRPVSLYVLQKKF